MGDFYEADNILIRERHINFVIISSRADFSWGDILLWHRLVVVVVRCSLCYLTILTRPTLTSRSMTVASGWGGTGRDHPWRPLPQAVPSAAGARSHCRPPIDGAFDVRNDEFGLCEVNNAKMDCYPEHACYRANDAAHAWDCRPVRSRWPVVRSLGWPGRLFAVDVILPQIRHQEQKTWLPDLFRYSPDDRTSDVPIKSCSACARRPA